PTHAVGGCPGDEAARLAVASVRAARLVAADSVHAEAARTVACGRAQRPVRHRPRERVDRPRVKGYAVLPRSAHEHAVGSDPHGAGELIARSAMGRAQSELFAPRSADPSESVRGAYVERAEAGPVPVCSDDGTVAIERDGEAEEVPRDPSVERGLN